jgi:hypothetical protein
VALGLPGGGFATYDQSGSGLIEYNHADHLGSIRLGSSPSRTFLRWNSTCGPVFQSTEGFGMKRIGLAWRVSVWLLSIGWIPVLAGEFCDRLFHLSQRSLEPIILIIPYFEFITAPLTLVAALIALYKGAKATIRLSRHDNSSESYQDRIS